MELFDNIIEQYREIENTVAMMLMEIHKKITEMEKLKMNETEMKKETSGLHSDIYVPFAAYEMQEERHHESFEAQEARNMEERQKLMDRHDAEMDKIRKHYKHLVVFITIPFAVFVAAAFAFAVWFVSNYDLATYEQDGDGLNNIANKTTQGDVIYGAAPSDNSVEELLKGQGDLDK